MNEFIEKLIGSLKEKSFIDYDEYYTDGGDCLVSISDVTEIVNELAEEYNGGWISCSERLPDSPCYILATLECNGETRVDKLYYSNTWMFEHMIIGWKFTAWQPLPAPFKEGE